MLDILGPVFVDSSVAEAVVSDLQRACNTEAVDKSDANSGVVDETERSTIPVQPSVTDTTVETWLRVPPVLTVLRVNTWQTEPEAARAKLESFLEKTSQRFTVSFHPTLADVILLESVDSFINHQIVPEEQEAIVDEFCGLAVLRGADVFSPGILSLPADISSNIKVSVWADLDKKCLRGRTKCYEGRKVFVGNGLLQMSRAEVFREMRRGLGIILTDRVYRCPSVNEAQFGGDLLLQNLPSILAVDWMDPRPGERVLDMCAAPGGKTTHIATRMQNTGTVVAFDKSRPKICQIEENAKRQSLTNIRAFIQDATSSIKEELQQCEESAKSPEVCSPDDLCPPFPPGSFDRVLLDAPCSALGQRPQFFNRIKQKELQSFPRLQKKLFATAVSHLKPGGVLVYSTCTVSSLENERLMDWAASHCPQLEPVSLCPNLPTPEHHYRRFGLPTVPASQPLEDTISFFVAKFRKKM